MLKTVVEALDGVEEAYRPLYDERDGKFVLKVEGIDDHPDVANLKGAYTRTKADRDAVKTKLTDYEKRLSTIPEDFDPKKWEDAKKGKADPAELVQLRRTLEAERDEWKGKYETTVAEAQRRVIEGAVADELQRAGVTNPNFIRLLRADLAARVKLDGDRPVVETDMGPMALPDFVKRWASGEGKDFVAAPAGGGARGSDRPGGGAQKTITAKELEAMTPAAKAKFFASNPGITVVD